MEKNNIIQSNYKPYISGLKGFACLMVMIGHYIGLYKYAEDFPVESVVLDFFDKFLDSKISFVLDESYWVILFFVVSGYLVANSKVFDFRTVISKSIIRFFRLGLPILFAYAIIFVMYKTIGFHTMETIGILENDFIQNAFSGAYDLKDVLKSPVDVLVFGKTSLNSPYWVLREMFFSSIVIYFFIWLKNKLSSKNTYISIVLTVICLSLFISDIFFSSLFGMIVALLEKEENEALLKNKVFY